MDFKRFICTDLLITTEQDPDRPKMAIPAYIFCRQVMTTTISNQNRTTGTNILLYDLHFLEPAEPYMHLEIFLNVSLG